MITGNDNTFFYGPMGPVGIVPPSCQPRARAAEEHQGVRILDAESQVCLLITCMLCARLLASLAPFLQVCANVTFSVLFRTASPPHPMVDPSPPLHPACSS